MRGRGGGVSGIVICKVSQNSRIGRWYSDALMSWYRFNWKIPEAQDRVTREGVIAIWNEIVQNPSAHSLPPPPFLPAPRPCAGSGGAAFGAGAGDVAVAPPARRPLRQVRLSRPGRRRRRLRGASPLGIPTIFRIRIRNPESNSAFDSVCVSVPRVRVRRCPSSHPTACAVSHPGPTACCLRPPALLALPFRDDLLLVH